MFKKTLAFDFDGVIHSYTSGWKGYTIIPDPPVEGMKELIGELSKKYEIIIFSARAKDNLGVLAIVDYLKKHQIYFDGVTHIKPMAVCYIDDRAIKFEGDAERLREDISKFKVWNKD
jgi:hypothetical protein